MLNICRAVNFKGIPDFFSAIRILYNRGISARVLFLCAFEPPGEMEETGNLRQFFESMFTRPERQRFTFMTMDWDYPFPLDLETLAHFYASSKVFVHAAPIERRCRTAAYAVGLRHARRLPPRTSQASSPNPCADCRSTPHSKPSTRWLTRS